MTDDLVKLASVAAVIALAFGIWAALWRGQDKLLAAINAAVGLGNILAAGNHLEPAIRYNETSTLVFFAFEASAIVAFAVLLFGVRVPKWLIVTLATINLLLMTLLAVFMLTFRLSRLF